MSAGIFTAPADRSWARALRARWMAGENLLMVQVEMASDALKERRHADNGKRECSPIYDAEAA